MKVGDLVKISANAQRCAGRIGVIVHMDRLSGGMPPLPRVLIGSKVLLMGRQVCEVINESR